jgi:hypothetical protein
MFRGKYFQYFLAGMATFTFLSIPLGCGEEQGLYEGEVLSFESPTAKTIVEDKENSAQSELNFGADESQNFSIHRLSHLGYGGGYLPYTYGYHAYYNRPLTYEIPYVSSYYPVVDTIHPFYAYRFFGYGDDDDDNFFWRDDD